MKIYHPNNSQQIIGGGWTFLKNFKKALIPLGYSFVDNWQEADIFFIGSVSMADAGEIEEANSAGKKIYFRIDNIPRKSRNKRGRVYDKMRRFSELSKNIIFQSKWAAFYAGWLTNNLKKSIIIYNGVDLNVFYPDKTKTIFNDKFKKFLFIQYNRDENKRFPEACYYFHLAWRNNKKHCLTLVGNFSPELIDAKFDFFAGEEIYYIPPIENEKILAQVYREHDVLLFPAFMDACPNTVLEARACGLEIACVNEIGGTKELLDPNLDISLERMGREYDNLFKGNL